MRVTAKKNIEASVAILFFVVVGCLSFAIEFVFRNAQSTLTKGVNNFEQSWQKSLSLMRQKEWLLIFDAASQLMVFA